MKNKIKIIIEFVPGPKAGALTPASWLFLAKFGARGRSGVQSCEARQCEAPQLPESFLGAGYSMCILHWLRQLKSNGKNQKTTISSKLLKFFVGSLTKKAFTEGLLMTGHQGRLSIRKLWAPCRYWISPRRDGPFAVV